jgi:hypothetical protein
VLKECVYGTSTSLVVVGPGQLIQQPFLDDVVLEPAHLFIQVRDRPSA